ncbi:MAG: hypothetical protein LKJ17_08305 [Oscillospiraceae bacterium]|nr:hypothetical protein [Oscillospiraceae bacterium]
MKKTAEKYIIVLLTITLSAALLFTTAFAQAETTSKSATSSNSGSSAVQEPDPGADITPEDDTKSSPTIPSSQVNTSSAAPLNPEEDGTENVDIPAQTETIPVKLNYNDGSDIKIVNVKPGTSIQSLAAPSRRGFVFQYWTMNGTRVSSTFQIQSEISLTAQWKTAAVSSKAPSSYASVDTHQKEVEQAASQAAAAVSDPDVLSSEDWNSLLSTGESSSGSTASASSAAEQNNGGGSWLFPAGIVLIALAACGIGAFVYLQFFSGPGPRGPHGPGSGPLDLNGGTTDTEFTDISSNSSGPHPAPNPAPAPRKTPGSDSDTKPIPRQPRIHHDMSQSQAKPVASPKKDFDWEKFFNDDI